jgi:hypothetical protein
MILLPNEQWRQLVWFDGEKWNLDGPDWLRSFWYNLRAEREIFSKRQSGRRNDLERLCCGWYFTYCFFEKNK